MQTFAILPVKRFALAKQRLSSDIDAARRRELAAAMVTDVLIALSQCEALRGIVVVTNETAVSDTATAAGALVLADDQETGQSAAAIRGIEHATALGAERVLLVPGDCPALSPAEVESLLGSSAGARAVAIVPDRHGTGTNALVLAPPGVIAPSFGPGSFQRHVGLARAAGVEPAIQRPASLLLDVDTGSDLDALRAALGARAGGAAHTRAVLDHAP